MIELSPKIDVYNFGMLVWEIFFEKVPFDGDLAQCTSYVVE
jgi:hypothetical protein